MGEKQDEARVRYHRRSSSGVLQGQSSSQSILHRTWKPSQSFKSGGETMSGPKHFQELLHIWCQSHKNLTSNQRNWRFVTSWPIRAETAWPIP